MPTAPLASGASRLVTGGCGDAWTVAPQPAPPPGTGTFNDVSASSSTDVWAVGVTIPGATGATTRSIHGAGTFTRRFDGTSWTDVASPNAPGSVSSSFWGVLAIAPNDAWAVGYSLRPKNVVRTLIERWDGTAWTIVPSPNAGRPARGYLTGVAAAGPDDVWAVGSYGPSREGELSRTLIEHWDGTAWTVVPSPNKGKYQNGGLLSVVAVAPNDVWAVGYWVTKASVQRTLTLHWDGTRWRRVASPNVGGLASVVAVAADDIWAVGSRGTRTLTEH